MKKATIIICMALLFVFAVYISIGQSLTNINLTDGAFRQLNDGSLVEYKSVYKYNVDYETMYITILPDSNKNTFEQMCYNIDEANDFKLQAHVQRGVEGSAPTGSTPSYANAELSARGKARSPGQRSLGVNFLGYYEWNGQVRLNLNKNMNDATRIKEKFCFEVLENIPDIAGFRTTFIHLYIKDLTKSPASNQFEDMGLYTHIEQINADYLKMRGFSDQSLMYEAENFDFSFNSNVIKEVDHKDYNEELFETALKIRRNNDNHRKLLEMMNAINNPDMNINDVVNKYFNRENLLTYTAVSILFGKREQHEGYVLYYGNRENLWYLLPRDFSDTLYNPDYELSSGPPAGVNGLPIYSENVLFRRFYSDYNNVIALNNKINEVYNIIKTNQPKVQPSKLYDMVDHVLASAPDNGTMEVFGSQLTDYANSFYDVIKMNLDGYNYTSALPVSPYIHSVQTVNNTTVFQWQTPINDSRNVKYNFQISVDPMFENITFSEANITDNGFAMNDMPVGSYYCRVIAEDDKGNAQISGNMYIDDVGEKYYGVCPFTVE